MSFQGRKSNSWSTQTAHILLIPEVQRQLWFWKRCTSSADLNFQQFQRNRLAYRIDTTEEHCLGIPSDFWICSNCVINISSLLFPPHFYKGKSTVTVNQCTPHSVQGTNSVPPSQQLVHPANRPDSCSSADVKNTNLRTGSSVCRHGYTWELSQVSVLSPEQELLDSVIKEDADKPSH